MQRTNRIGIKLLVTLVLFILAATSAVTSSADARGLTGPGASNQLSATRPGADLAAGEPDAGTGGGIIPQPPTNQKKLRGLPEGRGGASAGLADWVKWTGRIWATLYLRAAR